MFLRHSLALLTLFTVFCAVAATQTDRFTLDELSVVVKCERTAAFAHSDLERQSLFGKKFTWKDLIDRELIYQDALHLQVTIDEEMIDKYLTQIQRQNGMTPAQMQQVYESAGITEQQARHELKLTYAQTMMLDHKINSRMVIPERDIVGYYEKHPIVKEAKYKLSVALVPFDRSVGKKEQREQLAQIAKNGKSVHLSWRTPFWLKESEIAADKQFIIGMCPGDISRPQEMSDGFMLYRLEEKKEARVVPLHKRYRDITDELRRPRMTDLMQEYTRSLWNAASIAFFNVDPICP